MALNVSKLGHHGEVSDLDNSWKDFNRILVDTEEKFADFIHVVEKTGPVLAGFDTETTGLDFNTLEIVGASYSTSMTDGFYLPFAHEVGKNLPKEFFAESFVKVFDTKPLVAAYNKRYDFRVARKVFHQLGRDFYNPEDLNMFELSALVWNVDTDRWGKRAALKTVAHDMLGWDLQTFEQTLQGKKTIGWLRPEEALDYACYDVLILMHLAKNFSFLWKQRKTIVDIDDKMTDALIAIEDSPHPIDRNYCKRACEWNQKHVDEITADLKKRVAARLLSMEKSPPELETEEDVFDWARRKLLSISAKVDLNKLNLNSSTHVPVVFKTLKIDTGVKTPKGQISVSKKALAALEEHGSADPLISDIIKVRGFLKNVTYLDKFYRESEENGGVRCKYNSTRVTTGRLSASSDGDSTYFYSSSIQTVKKGKIASFLAVPGDEILGYDFLQIDEVGDGKDKQQFVTSEKYGYKEVLVGTGAHGIICEGKARDFYNVRRALIARPGHYFVHIDYNAEELRILANIARDQSMIEAFLSGKDLHSETVIDLFGSYDPKKRGICKQVNFLSSYGGSGYTLATMIGVSQQEAESILTRWWALRSGVRRWRDVTLQFAHKNGFVETAFGRKRWVDFLLHSQKWGEQKRGERLCLNSPIQGTAGDLMRLVIVKLYLNTMKKYNARARSDFSFLSTVHDEVNASWPQERGLFLEIAADVAMQMDVRLPGWEVPMVAEFEVGHDWGNTFKFSLEGGNPIPMGEEV